MVITGNAALRASCSSAFSKEGVPCRFDFGILVPLVLELLTQALEGLNCGKKPSQDEINKRLGKANSDIAVRMCVRDAVAKANKQQKLKMTGQEQSLMRSGLRDGFESMPTEVRMKMVSEAI